MKKRNKHRQRKADCDCFTCKHGKAATLQRQAEQMAKHGYYVQVVLDDPTTPTGFNAHSHGLDVTFNHPDLQIVLPLPPEFAAMIFVAVVRRIKAGERFEAGDRLRLFDDINVLFVEATESDRTVLRIILPDDDGDLDIGTIKGDFALQYADLIQRN